MKTPEELNRADIERFNEMIHGMNALGIKDDVQMSIFAIVAAILHLGNVDFVEDKSSSEDGSKVSAKGEQHLLAAAKLFGLDAEQLRNRLVSQRIKLPMEWITKKLRPEEAIVNRDSISKAMYEFLFVWLVSSINKTLEQDISLPWIGILDV
jgi:myosin-5